MKINRSRVNTGKISGKIRIRIINNGAGFMIGTILNLPAGARQVMLAKTNMLGEKIAEVVEDELDELIDSQHVPYSEELATKWKNKEIIKLPKGKK